MKTDTPTPINNDDLLSEMEKIESRYRQMNRPCYELFTLMSSFAIHNNYKYNIDTHIIIMNHLNEKNIPENSCK